MPRLRVIPRLLRRFGQIDARHRWLLFEAVAWLLLARIALLFVPFPRLARRLGTFVPPDDPRALQARLKSADDAACLAREVGWAVTCSARYVPFRAVCLPQGMAARAMLERRGVSSVLYFGATKGVEKPLEVHAWLDAAGIGVTGHPVAKDFSEIACFV
jgi:hypothetical protein